MTVITMLIDFEKNFAEYLKEYVRDRQLCDDEMEEMAPDIYLEWLESPQSWLMGLSPNAYFLNMDAITLIKLLGQYLLSDISLPSPLLNRISDMRNETYPLLISLLENYEGEREDSIRRAIVRLIEEMDMCHPYEYYIEVISQSENKNDFTETCADELRDAGIELLEPVMAAYEQAATSYAMDCFLDILTDMPYDERTYNYAMERFLFEDKQKAFYANCLGKIGNAKAIPALEEALRQEILKYYDYVAIRNALEELGGEVDIERDFSGDTDYESLIEMRDKH